MLYFHTHTEKGGIALRANCGSDCDCHAGESEGLAAARELLASARARGGEPTRAEVLAALDLATGGGVDEGAAAMTAGFSTTQLDTWGRDAQMRSAAVRRQFVTNAVFASMPDDPVARNMLPMSFAEALALKARAGKKNETANSGGDDDGAESMVSQTFAQAIAARDAQKGAA